MKLKSILLIAACAAALTISASRADSPKADSSVTVRLDGLMALAMGSPERASLGILNVAHHTPDLLITKKIKNRKIEIARLRGEELRGVLSISVEGRSDIARWQPGLDDASDFRHTIDLEGDLYQRALHLDEGKLFGKIHIAAGLWYAENLSEERVRFFASDGSGKALAFNRRVAAPAAKIDLAEGERLLIKGEGKSIELNAEPGASYEIAITNLPPTEMANIDHWLYYYDVIGEKVEKYMPVLVKKAALLPRPMLCEAVVFSKSAFK